MSLPIERIFGGVNFIPQMKILPIYDSANFQEPSGSASIPSKLGGRTRVWSEELQQ